MELDAPLRGCRQGVDSLDRKGINEPARPNRLRHQAGTPTRVVYMADREGDIHEIFAERERIGSVARSPSIG
jgi:hypothetical protein